MIRGDKRMKQAAAILLCVLVAGCATFSAGRYEKATADIADMIDSGDVRGLVASSETPFLLDGELIMLEQDVSTFWTNIVEAGFRIGSTSAVMAQPLDDQSFAEFAQTMEVKTFFQKYISEIGSVVVLKTDSFQLLLLLDRDRGRTTIVGFKGPEAL